jgi:3-phosphoshikimate 1-carboxyvinyltransferase
VRNESWQRFVIPAGSRYQSPGAIHVEADASSASYFIALGAIATATPGQAGMRILGVGRTPSRATSASSRPPRPWAPGESGPNWLQVSRGSLAAEGHRPGLQPHSRRRHDAGRDGAVCRRHDHAAQHRQLARQGNRPHRRHGHELRKLGATVEEGADYIRITRPPATAWKAASIHTYDDHRVAMCFSLAAFNPAGCRCASKTPVRGQDLPDYFEALFPCATPAQQIPVICIDGPPPPARARWPQVAERLGYHLLDSGALYRITGLAATRAGMALDAANAEPLRR